jgi:hypothetical protein
LRNERNFEEIAQCWRKKKNEREKEEKKLWPKGYKEKGTSHGDSLLYNKGVSLIVTLQSNVPPPHPRGPHGVSMDGGRSRYRNCFLEVCL